jgi:hypothetical protein
MNTSRAVFYLKKPDFEIEWKLLVFLILFLDVKLSVKAVAILFIYFMQPDFKFGFRFKHSRLPLFYVIVILIALLNFIFYPNMTGNYIIVAITGISIWTACILVIHQLKLLVDKTDIKILHNTLVAFFVLNIAFSAINLLIIFLDIGVRNPFLYQGQFQKYFINTGDSIKGLTFDTSTTNAVINAFGTIYFLFQKKYVLTLACMTTLLLTASNFSIIILVLVLTGIFFTKSLKEQKSVIVVCILMMVVFFVAVSPQNGSYISEMADNFIFKKPLPMQTVEKNISIRDIEDSLLTPEKRKDKLAILFLDSLARERIRQNQSIGKPKDVISRWRPEIPKDQIHTATFQWKTDTTSFQRNLYSYIQNQEHHSEIKYSESTPGKLQALRQSYSFLKVHENKIITGIGIGNFSSKLAFKATGLKMAGGFPPQLTYCSPDFLNNHLSLYAFFYLKNAHSHSILHTPDSVYDQLLTEYGFIGFLAFAIYYLGFFVRDINKLSYGLPLVILLLAFFSVDYWFEQLSIVVLFELMMFINMKEISKQVQYE